MYRSDQKGIKRFYILSNLGILVLLAAAISGLIMTNYGKAAQEHADELRLEILRSKHEFIQNAVDRTIQDIEQEKARCAAEQQPCDEEALKGHLRRHIRAIRLQDNGYLWINAVLNYEGGENYAYRFVHPNLPETEGMMLSTGMLDIKGNTPYLTELEGVKKDGEIFFDYWFKKMDSEEIQHKLTFAKLYKPYDWIIATGVYLDDIETLVQAGKTRWENNFRRNIFAALAVTGLASLLAWFFSIRVGGRVDKIYTYFLNEVAKREEELQRFNLGLEDEVARRTRQIATSERNYHDLYENAPDMYVTVNTTTGLIEQCNQTLPHVLGYSREELVGKPLFEIYHPDCLEQVQRTFRIFLDTGAIHDQELTLRCKDGSRIEASLSVTAVKNEDGAILFSRSTLRDITERKYNDAIDTARLHLMRFASDHPVGELLEETLNEAEKLTHSRIGFYHLVEEDQQTLTLQTWSTRTKAEFCRAEGEGEHYPISRAGVWVDCIRERRPVIHNDYASIPHRQGVPPGHPEIVRELVVPVMRNDRIMAVLGVGNKPVNYDDRDVKSLMILTDLVWEIVDRKQVDEALRLLNEELETRVRERTAELAAKNEELERMNKLFVGRELKMVELKNRIRELEECGKIKGKGGKE